MASTNQPNPIRTCHHCSKPSTSLLRCTQCKSSYYCNRACQSAAWNAGHRSICRRLRKRAEAAATSQEVDSSTVAHEALRDLARHVQSMDSDEAYKQMCLVQDEIQRLQSLTEQSTSLDSASLVSDASTCSSGDEAGIKVAKSKNWGMNNLKGMPNVSSPDIVLPCIEQAAAPRASKREHFVSGSWIDQGGACSIEFLPNVKCYLITLTVGHENISCVPSSREELTLDFSLIDSSVEDIPLDTSYYEAKVFSVNMDIPLLSLKLPTDKTISRDTASPNYSMSIDKNSISIRVQFHDASTAECTNVMDELLGINTSAFSSKTSDAKALNNLCCRTCCNLIIGQDNANQIRSVLPLPSGYWDEITDYLICYDGQPNVEFNSSSTSAIQGTALEDDAILILHKMDLNKEGGICELNIKGYGGYSSSNVESSFVELGSQPWKDKSSRSDFEVKTIACAICCSALGFVSSHDTNTYRFYKHLLSCTIPNSIPSNNIFAMNTCGSFLAREMIRYAESEAIYTFTIETDSRSITSRCISLRMLSWDTVMGITETKQDSVHQIKYEKVLKVIFEETSNKRTLMASDNPMDWKWGGLDLCCPPIQNKGDESTTDMMTNINTQTKATSVRICLSAGEWNEFKHSLMDRSKFFSDVVENAFVMTKLGMLSGNRETFASLSFLSVVT